MTSALERVARAAYEANITRDEKIRGWSKTDWSLIHPDNRENWTLVARAVLMAVRDSGPPDEMLSNNVGGDERANQTWSYLIDAILNEKDTTND